MPAGYEFKPQPNDVAKAVLASRPGGAGLTLDIELFTQAHTAPASNRCRAVGTLEGRLLFHWKEESQHAILDELEWKRETRA